MMTWIDRLSLKNKILVACLGCILLVSLVIALFTRWLLISSLTTELKRRGIGIAQSIAESSRVHMLTKNRAELTALAFDARLGNRNDIVVYLVISDSAGSILAHTFTYPVPGVLERIAALNHTGRQDIAAMTIGSHSIFSVTQPIKEGIYTIGAVHVGLDRQHIEKLIDKLRFLFFSFLSVVALVFFVLSQWLARYITQPVSALIRYTDRVTRGDYNITPENDTEIMDPGRSGKNDELGHLTRSFLKMTEGIRISRLKLEESEEKYRSLFTKGPNPIFVVDAESLEILDANPKACEVYGYSDSELKGMHFSRLGGLSDSTSLVETHSFSESMVNSKVKFYTRQSTSLYMNIHATPTRYNGRDAVILATADITELVEKDSQLIQASKMANLEKMSAGIAHELNQPLNAIKMGSEFFSMMLEKKQSIPEESLKEVSKEISAQVSRAAEIINRLRTFSRKADFARDLIDINNCVRAVHKILARQLKLQNIDLILDLDSGLPLVLAQNNRIEQVIFNLVTNARDAVNQRLENDTDVGKGLIRIDTGLKDSNVAITIEDNGAGISDHAKEKIFESFYTTKEMGEGMGLGLPIIRGIVRDYEGVIQFDSEIGRGSWFRILLPAHQTRYRPPAGDQPNGA